MIKTILVIVSSIMVLEFLVDWLKTLCDESPRDSFYRECLDCKAGFCMLDPGSKECKKWRRGK